MCFFFFVVDSILTDVQSTKSWWSGEKILFDSPKIRVQINRSLCCHKRMPVSVQIYQLVCVHQSEPLARNVPPLQSLLIDFQMFHSTSLIDNKQVVSPRILSSTDFSLGSRETVKTDDIFPRTMVASYVSGMISIRDGNLYKNDHFMFSLAAARRGFNGTQSNGTSSASGWLTDTKTPLPLSFSCCTLPLIVFVILALHVFEEEN